MAKYYVGSNPHIWFAIKVAFLSITYCMLVLLNGSYITGILFVDVFILVFLGTLFVLDYAESLSRFG